MKSEEEIKVLLRRYTIFKNRAYKKMDHNNHVAYSKVVRVLKFILEEED